MAPTRDALQDTHGAAVDHEGDLGRLIRWELESSVSEAEPSADVWPRIMSRVGAMDVPRGGRYRKNRSLFPLAPLLQAVVISVLLLVFGLEVNNDWVTPKGDGRAYSTPITRRAPTSQEYPDDVLRGCILARQAREAHLQKTRSIPES